mmetsp:Transcript_37279/g.42579  ORF Transcript_37279/g.42579 Transcript_37279/m.42579 type:complete len:350 (+) Transcript_37279:68-1117(+)
MLSEVEKQIGVKEPQKHDVLSGRGNFVNYHPGNEHFRSLVRKHKVAYLNCPKSQKSKFSQIIVDQIQSQNPPGRFLKQHPETKLWNDIGEKKALDKTRQALREGAPELLKEINNSDINLQEEKTAVQEKSTFNTNVEASLPELIPMANVSPEKQAFCDRNHHYIPNSISTSGQQQLHSIGVKVEDMMHPYRMETTRATWIQQSSEDNHIEPLGPFPSTISNQRENSPEYKKSCHQPPTYQRDESLQFDSLFEKMGEKTTRLDCSSIMSCSTGEITEASLSAVFEDSLRISDFQRLAPLQETNGLKKGLVTDTTDFSITSPEMNSYGSSMFEGNNMSSINFDNDPTDNAT